MSPTLPDEPWQLVLLAEGDVIIGPGGRRYTVEGHTKRGKLILRRESGTIRAVWWRSPADLPRGYELEPPEYITQLREQMASMKTMRESARRAGFEL